MSDTLTLRMVLETDQAEKQIEEVAEKTQKAMEDASKASAKVADGIRGAMAKVQAVGDSIINLDDTFSNLGGTVKDATKSVIRLVAAAKILKAASISAGTAALGGISLIAKQVPGAQEALARAGDRLKDMAASTPRLGFLANAVDGIATAASNGEQQVLKLNDRMTLFGRAAIFVKNNKVALFNFAKAALLAGAAIGAVVLAFGALEKAAGVAQQRIDVIGSQRIWQIQQKEVDAYRDSLNDVKTGLEALATVTELRQLGFSEADVVRLGKMVNIIAAVTGEAKESVEQRLKGAQVSERDLGVFSKLTGELKTQQGVQNAIAQATLKAGGATLTLAARSQAVSQYLAGSADAAVQLEKNLGRVGQANPFTIMRKTLRTIREDIVTYIAPSILKAFQSVLDIIEKVGKGWAAIFVVIRNGWTEGRKILKAMRDQELAQAKRNAAALTTLNKKTQAQEQQAHNKTLAMLRQQKAQQEAIQEAIGRQQRARTLMRNFEREALSRIAAFGARGISQTISGFSQLVELSKVLGSNFEGNSKSAQLMRLQLQAGFVAAKKLAINEEIQTASLRANLALSQSIKAEVQAQAQLRDIEGSLSGGVLSVNKAIQVLEQSKSSLAEKGIQQLRVTLKLLKDQADLRRQVVQLTLQRARIEEQYQRKAQDIGAWQKLNGVLEQQRQLREKLLQLSGFVVRDRGAAAAAAVEKTDLEIQQAQSLLTKYRALTKTLIDKRDVDLNNARIRQQQVLIKELQGRLKLEEKLVTAQQRAAKAADAAAKNQIATAARQAKERQRQLNNQLINMRAQRTGGQGVLPGVENLAKTQAQIDKLKGDIATFNTQLATLDPTSNKAQQLQNTITARSQELALLKDIRLEQELMLKREKERLTVVGSFVQTMQNQVRGFQQRLGKQIADGVLGLAQSMSSAIGSLFSDLVSEPAKALDNLGKNILSAFGDMALQLAGFFAAEAIGMAFTPGGQAAAVGLGVAAGALAAIGGTLKGVAASIGAPPTPTAATSSSGAMSRREGLPGAQPGREQPKTETVIIVTDQLVGSEEDRARRLADLVRRNRRAMGGRGL